MRIALVTILFAMGCSSGSAGTPSGTGTTTNALDGTWDITSVGGRTVTSSSLLIQNGRATGKLDFARTQGQAGCFVASEHVEFDVAFEGNVLSGSLSRRGTYEGTDCSRDTFEEQKVISGARATSASGIDGEWDARVDKRSFTLVIEGTTAKAGSKRDVRTKPDVEVSVAGGVASATSDRDYTFAARRR